jgi:hypothetical protein
MMVGTPRGRMIGLLLTKNWHWSWPETIAYVSRAHIVSWQNDGLYEDRTTVILRDGSWILSINTPEQIERMMQ